MPSKSANWLRRWILAVDIAIYLGCAAITTLVVAGMSHCTADGDAGCFAFTRYKAIGCVIAAAVIFQFWLRRKRLGKRRDQPSVE